MSKVKIGIIAGHGGADRRNVGVTTYIEADGMLALSKLLFAEFKRQPNFDPINVRESDVTMSLDAKVKVARDFGASIILDLHSNAYTATEGYGSEGFYIHKNSTKDKAYVSRITSRIAKRYETVDRGAKTRLLEDNSEYYGTLRYAVARGVSRAFILEILFHDKRKEEAVLLDPKELKEVAKIICEETCVDYGFKYVPEEDKNMPIPNKPKTPFEALTKKVTPLVQKYGISDGTNPSGNVTRAQTWLMILRAISFTLKVVKLGTIDKTITEIDETLK